MTNVQGPSNNVLNTILARKRDEIEERKSSRSLKELEARLADAPPPAGFHAAIEARVSNGECAVIAEIKKASPSRGVIREDFDVAAIASSYAAGGAACLSVLTDKDFFQGHDDYLAVARESAGLPVLRKEFIIDAYQVYESRAIGADCILLIVAALDDPLLRELAAAAISLDMDVLAEVHDREELERALMLRTPLVGINNRDLHTFDTSLETTIGLLPDVFPDRIVVTESGIRTRSDVALMRRHGVGAFLVGEVLMQAPDPGAALKDLFN